MDTIQLIDSSGETRFFRPEDLYEQLAKGGFKLLGMDIRTVLQLRAEYQKLAGPEPITEHSVRETFSKYGPSRERPS